MRHPRLLPFLVPFLAASLASAACGGPLFSTAASTSASDDDLDAGTDAGPATNTVIVGPPDASSHPHDASLDSSSSDSSRPDAEPDQDGTTPPADASEPTDSSPASDTGPSCSNTQKLCGTQCVLLTDPAYGCNAASCDPCDLPHATSICGASGACAVGACNPDYADCNADPGCETNTTIAASCGSCTNVCPTTAPDCVPGDAGYACSDNCPTGTPSLCGTTCVDEETDPNHCGGCSTVCNAAGANATNQCVASKCEVVCDTNYSSCDGACVDYANDDDNCGSCGHKCAAIANGSDTCVSSSCTPACNAGYQLCGIGGTTTCVAPDVTNGTFVSPSSVTTGCGSIGAPCGTIASGIQAAKNDGKTIIYLAAGTYAEQVTVPSGMTIQGGWTYEGSGQWSMAVCTGIGDPSMLAVIQTTSGGITVSATSVTATLDTLTVKNAATATAGQSLYGIFASGTTNLTLNAVEVSVAAGGNGAPSTALGAAPTAPGPSCTPGDGNPATTKGANGGSLASSYSNAGFTPGAGAPGVAGAAGDNGAAGGSPKTANNEQCTGGEDCSPNGQITTGNPGTNGCGGPGGAPGLGGGGGGASIALFVTQATVNVVGGKLGSGNGGSGGVGANGGAAPATWTYQNGQAGGSTNVPTCRTQIISMVQACFNTSTAEDLGGAAGGAGGAGSAGGNGGTGTGGDSYSYYLLAGSGGSVTSSGSPAMTNGTVSAGGHAGAHN